MKMKSLLLFCISLCLFSAKTGKEPAKTFMIAPEGKQPDIAAGTKGELKVVYGKADSIYFISSPDGSTFSEPAAIAGIQNLSLGMGRGPQIAVTKDYTVVSATSESGNIYAYSLDHRTNKWSQPTQINDADTLAKEGFVAIAAGAENQVYAVWLDLRSERENKVYGAVSTDGGKSWSANKLIYQSPEGKGSVCECCKPSVIAYGNQLHIMFRNSLQGARDLYLVSSMDGGSTFGNAQKLGNDSWSLKACPMDGGDLATDAKGKVMTVWRRKNELFVAEPGKAEQRIGEGKSATITRTATGDVVAWHKDGQIIMKTLQQSQVVTLGEGTYPKLVNLPDKRLAICIWEGENGIFARKID